MSENLKQGLLTFAAAVLFCLAVVLLIDRIDILYRMADALKNCGTGAVTEYLP